MLTRVCFVLVTALSLGAGIPKLVQAPSEAEFFAQVGLGPGMLAAFGMLQLAAGALLVSRRSRRWGAGLAALLFLGSAAMLLVTGQIAFAIASLLPVAMAAVVFLRVR